MKLQKYTYIVLVVLAFFTLTNCQDLNYDESTGNTNEEIFNDFARSRQFISGIYAYLPTDYNSLDGAMRASATDEAEHVNDLSAVQKFNDGSWSAVQQLDNVWGTMFNGIRAANVYLKESEGQTFPDQQYTNNYANIIQQYRNYPFEARFLRAFFYFELVKRYKSVPIITTVLTVEEAANVEQASFEQVVDFIVSECDAVAAVLPLDYPSSTVLNETGRATKGAALALKARVLLYAASPLHNTTEDLALWQKAASAAKELMDLGKYSLNIAYSDNFIMLAASPTSELIMERRVAASSDFERRNFPVGFENGGTGTCPTQNLVDAYEMRAKGLPITDVLNSGYDKLKPYSNRDTRLATTVLFNGAPWQGVTIESFIGGRNGLPLINATKTGYYLRKYLLQDIDLRAQAPAGALRTKEHNWILFRYAEVLLNYAEAMNEAYGPEAVPSGGGMTALAAVNLVRVRANPTINNNNPSRRVDFRFPTGMTKDAFRAKLRNERRIELAFEDHRFWDIRRWKIGNETREIYGMKIEFNQEDPQQPYSYEKVLIETRVFEDRMNLYPKPQSEIFKSNGKLKQNTGW